MGAINDLDFLSCNIQNAYLAAPNKEKVWTKFDDQLISKARYGLRSSERLFRDKLALNMRELGFILSKADPDLWMRPGSN